MKRRQPRHWTYHEEKLRKAVLRRDNYECQIRGPGCLLTANTVDHIHPKVWGGRATPDNLRAACKPCNQSKGARAEQPRFLNSAHARRAPLLNLSPHTSRWAPETVDYSAEGDDE